MKFQSGHSLQRRGLMEQRKCILLNVYDIHDSNVVFNGLGLGFYHSGIEVSIESDTYSNSHAHTNTHIRGGNGMGETISYEYSFSTSGISRTAPRLRAFGVLRNSIIMGTVRGSAINIHKLISQFGRTTFAPGSYDLVHNNCNHFTDAVCWALLETHIPSWVNRFAYLGSSFIPPQPINSPTDSAAAGSGGGGTGSSKKASGAEIDSNKQPAVRRRDNHVLSVDESETPESDWVCGLPIQLSVPTLGIFNFGSPSPQTGPDAAGGK